MRSAAIRASEQMILTAALRTAERSGLFDSLARVYATFERTTCDSCARCCFESPGVFFVEHLRLVKLLDGMPQPQRQTLLRRAVGELFFSWIDPNRTCIFLDGANRCSIYEQRPLACRLFGFVAPSDRETAEVEARMSAREEARRLARLGITIPEEIVTRSLVSCDRVRDTQGRPVRHVDADDLAARVARLDEALLPREVVLREFCFRSLPDRLGAARLGAETVETMRIQLLRRAQNGERVEDLVREVLEAVRSERTAQARRSRTA